MTIPIPPNPLLPTRYRYSSFEILGVPGLVIPVLVAMRCDTSASKGYFPARVRTHAQRFSGLSAARARGEAELGATSQRDTVILSSAFYRWSSVPHQAENDRLQEENMRL